MNPTAPTYNPSISYQVINHTKNRQFVEEGLLPTALVKIYSTDKSSLVRALIDCGSQSCFIREDVVRRLDLPIQLTDQEFVAAGNQSLYCLGKTSFPICSRLDESKTYHVDAYILNQITTESPLKYIDRSSWRHLKGLELADENFHSPGKIDLLLGSSIVDKIFQGKRISGGDHLPGAHSTELGYVVFGTIQQPIQRAPAPLCNTIVHNIPLEEISQTMKKFQVIESIPDVKPVPTPDNAFCEANWQATTTRMPTGRIQTTFPIIPGHPPLGASYPMARRCNDGLETKLEKPANIGLAGPYHDNLQSYKDNDEMELVPEEEIRNPPLLCNYIPHLPVVKESSTSTKIRVVFNASAKTSNGVSLSSIMYPGPTLIANLFDQLLKFRLHRISFLCDLKQFYRQILIHPDQRDLMRIVWRKKKQDPLRHWRLKIAAFGITSSPYLANRAIKQLAQDIKEIYPFASQILDEQTYVDDIIASVATVSLAKEYQQQIIAACKSACFEATKWASCSDEVILNVPPEMRELQAPLSLFDDANNTVKTLGVKYNAHRDYFYFVIAVNLTIIHTMRSLLSEISKIFDPHGFLSPVVISTKITMQLVWKIHLSWDQVLPKDILDRWNAVAQQLHLLEKLRIPRYLQYEASGVFELHGFSDASELAYGAVVYIRGVWEDRIDCRLVASKSRVAPLNLLTIPRLELQSCVILVDLMTHIIKTLNIPLKAVQNWSDSQICIAWIHGQPNKYKQYVANRIQHIHNLSEPDQWSHVAGVENPADISSRGVTPLELINHPTWFSGPRFLYDRHYRTKSVQLVDTPAEETKKITAPVAPAVDDVLKLLSKFSSWTKAVRVLAYILRVARHGLPIPRTLLSPMELWTAEKKLSQLLQQFAYSPEIKSLQKGTFHKLKDRHFQQLCPFLDADGLLRVGGRIDKSLMAFDAKHPVLLPNRHPLTRALVLHAHTTLAHAQRNTVLNHLRQRYWIPNGSKLVKSVINNCVFCFRFTAKPEHQLMSDLPRSRLELTRPFLRIGIDYCGPFQLKGFVRSKVKFSAWICLFTCYSTRAVHLEVVCSLSTEAFLLAFRRMISRRGRPSHVSSDHGTNFVGAAKIIDSNFTTWERSFKEKILPDLQLQRIIWTWIPPKGPHHGGLWESMVKVVKTQLRKILKDDTYTYEEFLTITTYVESLVNSRPITPMSNDPNDMTALTPASFLIGEPSMQQIPCPDLNHLPINQLNNFQLTTRRSSELKKQWYQEYLKGLQTRNKWTQIQPNLKEGDMVLMVDDSTPSFKWQVGRVREVHPGEDKLVRVATVETEGTYNNKKGKVERSIKEFVRPIAKLAKLPLEQQDDLEKDLVTIQPNSATPGKAARSQTLVTRNGVRRVSAVCFIQTLLLTALFLPPVRSYFDENPDITKYAPLCSILTPPLYHIPPCSNKARWFHVFSNGSVCAREMKCVFTGEEQISADGRSCISTGSCSSLSTVQLDPVRCQNLTVADNVQLLKHPPMMSDLCAVGDLKLRNCQSFVSLTQNVPVAIHNSILYPVSSVQLHQQNTATSLEAYECSGSACSNANCKDAGCSGDAMYCGHFSCIMNSIRACYCRYKKSTEHFKVNTDLGSVFPQCFGSMLMNVEKEDNNALRDAYVCHRCEITCTRKGLKITTPELISRYIRAQKNPGVVTIIPTSTVTELHLTNSMLSIGGSIEIELYFLGYDFPTKRTVQCPRIEICELLDCYVCFDKWANVSCYFWVNWALLSTAGVVIATFIMFIIWISRCLWAVAWFLIIPMKTIWQCIRTRCRCRKYQPVPLESDEENAFEMSDYDPSIHSPYRPTTLSTNRNRPRGRRPAPRQQRGQAYIPLSMAVLLLVLLFSLVDSCSNNAILTASSRECVTMRDGSEQCLLRINNRLTVSPIGQQTCFKMQNEKGEILGTIVLDTASVTLKCQKQLLYYVPRSKTVCHSSIQCFSLYQSDECNTAKCARFGLNDTIRDLGDSINQLGWSNCHRVSVLGCGWVGVLDCIFTRVTLENPTRESYVVYNCPTWKFHLHLHYTMTIGSTTTSNSITLQGGVPAMIKNIQFTLVDISLPPLPILNHCVINKGNQAALVPCNDRGQMTPGTLGEVFCDSADDAKLLNRKCFANSNLVRSFVDPSGIKCVSDLLDPAKLMEVNPLPLKLENGVLLPHGDSIVFESSANTMLEIQMDAENLQLTKTFTETTCAGNFVMIQGCYSCSTSSTLIIEAKIEEGSATVYFECPTVGFFIPLLLDTTLTRKVITIRLDTPEPNFHCHLKCSKNQVDMIVTGHLEYLSNRDYRDNQVSMSFEPLTTTSGFSWLSISGFSWYSWGVRGIAGAILLFGIIGTLYATLKLVMRKIL